MKQNEHLQAIPANVLAEAQQKLNEVNALLAPYEVALTPQERRNMYTMGDKSAVFVEKAHDFAVQNPAFVPPYLDMTAFQVDCDDAMGLRTLLNTAQQVVEGIEDTTITAGSEAFQSALVFYNSVKYAAMQDAPGAKAVYEELRKRFPRGKRKTSADQPEDEQ